MKNLGHLLKLALTIVSASVMIEANAASGPIVIQSNTDASALASALANGTGSGLTVRQSSLQGHSIEGAASTGLYFLSSEGEANGYGLTLPGIVLSTGNVRDYQSGPNSTTSRTTAYGVAASADQETLLDPITRNELVSFNHRDVTQLDIEFDVTADKNFISFFVVFGSEEYPEFVNSEFIDGFGIFLNGQNIALASGKPVNINHPEMMPAAGTELDGVLSPQGSVIMQFTGLVQPGSTANKLTFIIADTTDSLYDTTVYISGLESTEPPPPLTISNGSVVEGNDGTRNMVFQVELSAEKQFALQTAAETETVHVSYSTADVTARAGIDYTASSGLLTFPPGTNSRQILIPILGDTVSEGNETFQVRLSNPVGASFAGQPAVGTIIDDDASGPISVFASVSDVTVTEGDSGFTYAVFKIMLSCPSDQVVRVNYRTVNGTASQGTDFLHVTGTIEFEPGEIERTVTVCVNGDTLNEAKETFSLVLTAPVNAVLGDDRGVGTIMNDDPVTAKLSIFDASVQESSSGTAIISFLVCLSEVSGQNVAVTFTTANGTALAGSDYVAAKNSLTIPAGLLSKTVSITVKSDGLPEPSEQFFVRLSGAVNATIEDNEAVGTILDNPTPGVSIGNVTLTEGNEGTTIARFEVVLSVVSEQGVVVGYSTADGTAKVVDNDYVPASGVLMFPPGLRTNCIDVLVNGDLRNEGNETFSVILNNNSSSLLKFVAENEVITGVLLNSKVTGTILNDDAVTAQISIDGVTVLEPAAGSVSAVFNVSLSEPSGQTVTVKFKTANDTATSGSDYAAKSGFISFPPGSTNRTIVVSVNGDTILENSETFFVDLNTPVNATIQVARATGTILNATGENSQAALSIADTSVIEGNSGYTQMVFTVTMPFPSDQTVTAQYVTANSSARAGEDYISASGTVTFPPGSTSQTITVQVLGDIQPETDEGFFVTLSQPVHAILTRSRAGGKIVNDEPILSIADTSVIEGNSGYTQMVFTVTMPFPSDQTVTAQYVTANSSARAGEDYISASGTVTFPPGSTSQTITIQVLGEVLHEPNEAFFVTLSQPVHASLKRNRASGFILNDEAVPKITILNTSTVEGDNGSRYMEFDLSLSSPSSKNITVLFATADGTAIAPHSYESRSGILVFPSGTTTQCVAVVVYGNVTIESDKTMHMLLSKAVNATIEDGEGVGTIVNDDGLPGHLDHFTWSAISSPQIVNEPFAVTITARDRFGDVVPNYSGIVNLSAIAVSLDEGGHNLLGSPVHQLQSPGNLTVGYAFTPSEDMVVTHIRHYRGTKVSLWSNSGELLASRSVASTPGTWLNTSLDSPVLLKAGTTYRVGVLTAGYYYRFGTSSTFAHGSLGGNFQFPGDNFPTQGLAVRPFVDLVYSVYGGSQAVAVQPQQSGVFVDGVWSGQIAMPATADLVSVQADDGFGHIGSSGSFVVQAGVSPMSLKLNVNAAGPSSSQLLSVAPSTGAGNLVQLFFTPRQPYVIEASTDLNVWTPVFTNTTGSASSFYAQPVSSGQSFYRAVLMPK